MSINLLVKCSNTFKNGNEIFFACKDFPQISETYGFVQIPGNSDVQKTFYPQF
jgi:hypothetical protein